MLNEAKIRSLKPKKSRYLICDADGLYLAVYPTGSKAWFFRRQTTDGKEFKKKLGGYPEIKLYDARLARDSLRLELQNKEKHGVVQPPFHDLAEEWLNAVYVKRVTPKAVQKQKSRLIRYIYPVIGHLMPDEITAPKVLEILRQIEAFGYNDVSHDVLQLIGQILRYGIASGKATRDISADLRGALAVHKVTHRASLRSPEEIGGLMRAVWGMPEGSVKWSLLLNAYTFVRPGEVRLAVWSEIFMDQKEWHIPAERMKMRRPHIVPLSRQALDVLERARSVCHASDYICPSLRTPNRPLSNMAALAALRRIGYARKEMSVHGFRSVASTTLHEYGWLNTAIERQLAHVDDNKVRAAYNYAEHLPLRRLMMQWYADYLDALRDGSQIPELPKQQLQ